MLYTYGYDSKEANMLRDNGHVPTLDEQAVRRLQHGGPHTSPVNQCVAWVLSSPLHGLLSRAVMLISVTGLRSGRTITTPVNYVAGKDGELYVLSERSRRWWRNLNGGAHVTLRLRGEERSGFGAAVVKVRDVTRQLEDLLARAPSYARPLNIHRDPDGKPDVYDLVRAAQKHVVICIHLH